MEILMLSEQEHKDIENQYMGVMGQGPTLVGSFLQRKAACQAQCTRREEWDRVCSKSLRTGAN